MSLKLDLRTDLPRIRAAYEAGELQAQQPDYTPSCYRGPCAVGVLIPAEERRSYDTDPSGYAGVANLIEAGSFLTPDEQLYDWAELQHRHDNWNGYERDGAPYTIARANFVEFLTELEAKYAR